MRKATTILPALLIATTAIASLHGKPAVAIDVKGADSIIAVADTNSCTANDASLDSVQKVKTYAVRTARRGIIVVDSGAHTRAIEPFNGSEANGLAYIRMVNDYKRTLGDSVNVFCMLIPNAVAFYCPDEARRLTKDERPFIGNLLSHLSDSVARVDIADTLASHAAEPIYSRTDHHWSPLGAYYAARQFAAIAGTDFRDLNNYDRRTVADFVGSMYTFSKDIAVKNAPEEFVYYVPRGIDYSSTFTNYTIGKNQTVLRVSQPEQREFFIAYPDGNSGAYCTFMGGDTRTVKVVTGCKNGRRLVIMKDSYGNALPAYLFYGFEEIHVVDFRYFTENIKSYISKNAITDLLFANNLIHACMENTPKRYLTLLNSDPKKAQVAKQTSKKRTSRARRSRSGRRR